VAAKKVAHEVAVTSKEGAPRSRGDGETGAARAKAAVNGEKTPSPPAKPVEKPRASPQKAPAP